MDPSLRGWNNTEIAVLKVALTKEEEEKKNTSDLTLKKQGDNWTGLHLISSIFIFMHK